jgi:hypothetical protein
MDAEDSNIVSKTFSCGPNGCQNVAITYHFRQCHDAHLCCEMDCAGLVAGRTGSEASYFGSGIQNTTRLGKLRDLPQARLKSRRTLNRAWQPTGVGARCQVQRFTTSRKILLPSYFRHSADRFGHPTNHFRNLQAGKQRAMLPQDAVSDRTCQSLSPCFVSFGQSKAARNRRCRISHRA